MGLSISVNTYNEIKAPAAEVRTKYSKGLRASMPNSMLMAYPIQSTIKLSTNSFQLIGMNVGNLTDSGMVHLSDIKNRLCSDLQRYPRGYN